MQVFISGQDGAFLNLPTTIIFVFIPYPLHTNLHFGEGLAGAWVLGVLVWVEAEAQTLDELVDGRRRTGNRARSSLLDKGWKMGFEESCKVLLWCFQDELCYFSLQLWF